MVVEDSFYLKNRLFDLSDKVANRDNCLLPFSLLKEDLRKRGIDLATSDIHKPEESELLIFNEMPQKPPQGKEIDRAFLLLFESELIRPDNWNIENHKYFKKIFTWNDDLVDNKKYYKINFSLQLPNKIHKDISQKKTLCTLIAGNKRVTHPQELYSKRIEAIRWFETFHPKDFDLYGMGWDSFRFSGPKLIRALNKIKYLTRLLATDYPSYKGKVDEKKSVLEKYKFSICYENARDIPGYITEKIFDSFVAGCIPVYWGAGNIAKHIPAECFIDKREFSSYEDLYGFLVTMSDKDYLSRLDSIERFLSSDKAFQFSVEYFASVISNQLTL